MYSGRTPAQMELGCLVTMPAVKPQACMARPSTVLESVALLQVPPVAPHTACGGVVPALMVLESQVWKTRPPVLPTVCLDRVSAPMARLCLDLTVRVPMGSE